MALAFWLRVLEAAMRVRGIRRRRLTTSNGYELSYHEFGRRRKGPVVVLVHGLATSSVSWVRVIPKIAKTHRVLALDLPGFGFSPFPKGQDFSSVKDGYLALVGFLDAGVAPGRVVLVGNSLGGWVAAKAARLREDRVEQLVLVNNAGVLYPKISELRDRIRVETREHVREFWDRMWYRVPFFYLYFWKDYIGHMQQPAVTRLLDSVSAEDFINADLAELKVPTTIIWGRSDRFLPLESVDLMIRELKSTQVYWMPRTGHIPQLESPGLFAEILRGLLQRIPPAAAR